MNLSNKTLHKNYLLLLRFQHPGEPIKKWVEEDEDHVGNYHNDIQWIWPVIERIEALGHKVTIATDFMEIKMYNSLGEFAGTIMVKVKGKKPSRKTTSIYQAIVSCVKSLKSMQKSEAKIYS